MYGYNLFFFLCCYRDVGGECALFDVKFMWGYVIVLIWLGKI